MTQAVYAVALCLVGNLPTLQAPVLMSDAIFHSRSALQG